MSTNLTLEIWKCSNFSLQTFRPNLVSLTWPSLPILGKTQSGLFPISGFLVKPLLNENCHNSRTSTNIDMKVGQITKLDKRNTATPKKFGNNVMSTSCDVFSFFQFIANLEQNGFQIPDAWFIKLTFLLIVTFYI